MPLQWVAIFPDLNAHCARLCNTVHECAIFCNILRKNSLNIYELDAGVPLLRWRAILESLTPNEKHWCPGLCNILLLKFCAFYFFSLEIFRKCFAGEYWYLTNIVLKYKNTSNRAQLAMTCTWGMSAVDRLREEARADWPDWFRSSPSFPSRPPPRLSPPPPPPSSPPPPPPLLCTMALGMGGGRWDIFNISLSLTFHWRSKQVHLVNPPQCSHTQCRSPTKKNFFGPFATKCCCWTCCPPPAVFVSSSLEVPNWHGSWQGWRKRTQFHQLFDHFSLESWVLTASRQAGTLYPVTKKGIFLTHGLTFSSLQVFEWSRRARGLNSEKQFSEILCL